MKPDLTSIFRRRRRRVKLAYEITPPSRRRMTLTRILLVALLLAATLFAFPLQVRFDPPNYLAGTIAPEDLLAPFSFDVPKAPADFERERALEAAKIPPVFAHTDRSAELRGLLEGLRKARTSLPALNRHLEAAKIPLSTPTRRMLAQPDSGQVLMGALEQVLLAADRRGLLDEDSSTLLSGQSRITLRTEAGDEPSQGLQLVDSRELAQTAAAAGREALGPSGATALTELAKVLARPNITYDHEATERARTAARATVSPVRSTILAGERIVAAHERITPEDVVVLQAMQNAWGDRTAGQGASSWLLPLLGRGLLVTVMVFLLGVFLRNTRPRIWGDLNLLSLLATVSLLTLGLAAAIARVPGLHPYLVPIPLAAILITLLVDEVVALALVAWLAALVGAVSGWGLPATLVGFVGGMTAVYTMRRVVHRMAIYRAMFLIAFAILVAVAGVTLVSPAVPWETLLRDLLWGLGNAVLYTALAMLILPVFEKVFDLVTDISLLELSDLNRPIFKRMVIEANGTYHHSMVIGSLAEAAAEVTGANPLLARVGSYYHDIGKIAKSSYFGENMRKGSKNPHERLTPTMSSLILESHVREGLELAREIGLPRQVAAFIPEHQGTTLMQYFYTKAQEMDPGVDERDYRYPGPRPQNKETGIVMLADASEATVRSLDDQSPNKIRAVLQRLFDLRMADGQLDECGLTISDLARIREAFTHVLTGVYHGRVKYQWQKDGGEDALGAGSGERVFRPELETGLGTREFTGAFAAVSESPGQDPRG